MNTILRVVDDKTPDISIIAQAAEVIRRGGLVAFPTETVYGLGANGIHEDAANAIFTAKGRPADNPLILHIADPGDAELYAYTSPLYYRLAEAFMPGPLTVVLSAKEIVPLSVRAMLPTVAVRCPIHPVAQALIRASGTAIAAPSANLSGSPSPTCGAHVLSDMNGRIDMILDGGECSIGVESTIVKILDDETMLLLRPGGITLKDLEKIGQVVVAEAVTEALKEGQIAESPGMKHKHYAPKSPLILLKGDNISRQKYILDHYHGKESILCYTEEIEFYSTFADSKHIFDLGPETDIQVHCNRLFKLLREADIDGIVRMFAPLPKTEGIGLALYNRMIRAAAHQIVEI